MSESENIVTILYCPKSAQEGMSDPNCRITFSSKITQYNIMGEPFQGISTQLSRCEAAIFCPVINKIVGFDRSNPNGSEIFSEANVRKMMTQCPGEDE